MKQLYTLALFTLVLWFAGLLALIIGIAIQRPFPFLIAAVLWTLVFILTLLMLVMK